ncbi:MAG: hypothetical protein B7Z44_03235 [Caulobacter sp. 12-67-6]|nr:MAG: hypothetical protein B7Z44_03235 [Caulobacter sp. 12-67-6]OYX69869.1 MAG: hypothetical protein B7Y81_13020 [Caulobacter sp. 32-67-35]OYX93619.1 MAG: hypothetical protein B7Y78_08145 [Caulobacter sp. 35-67-4]
MTPPVHQGLARRDLLTTLLALTAGAALPTLVRAAEPAGAFADLDRDAVERIGKAWLEQNPGTSAKTLAMWLFPSGQTAGTLADLRRRATEDFRKGAVFIHRGWRLSQTEGALFGLLALGSQGGR